MKSISFFLQPKQDVVYLSEDGTMRQAIEKIEHYGYTAVPTIDEAGRYVRTLTEGDLLRKMKNSPEMTFQDTGYVSLRDVASSRPIEAVYIEAKMEDLLGLALRQNFVPVVDDDGIFIGIVTRKTIIAYFMETYLSLERTPEKEDRDNKKEIK